MQGKHRVMRLVKKALSPGFVLEAVWGQRAGKGPSQTCAVSGMGLLRGSGLGTLLSVMCGEEGLRLKSSGGEAYSRVASALQTQLWKSYY